VSEQEQISSYNQKTF